MPSHFVDIWTLLGGGGRAGLTTGGVARKPRAGFPQEEKGPQLLGQGPETQRLRLPFPVGPASSLPLHMWQVLQPPDGPVIRGGSRRAAAAEKRAGRLAGGRRAGSGLQACAGEACRARGTRSPQPPPAPPWHSGGGEETCWRPRPGLPVRLSPRLEEAEPRSSW